MKSKGLIVGKFYRYTTNYINKLFEEGYEGNREFLLNREYVYVGESENKYKFKMVFPNGKFSFVKYTFTEEDLFGLEEA